MEELIGQLLEKVKALNPQDRDHILKRFDSLKSVYPFNESEFLLASLIGLGKISLDEYFKLREDYITQNRYLHIFEISAPRGFGETWAQGHLQKMVPALLKPSKKLDPKYSGQYDFRLDDIRIEVKASRAVDFNSSAPLYVKALSSDSSKQFDMNFQQVKPACCDVFVWIGVWKDQIRYWVLASQEVESNKYYSSGQHRGNVGEGQLHLNKENIAEFTPYESNPERLLEAIQDAYARQIE